MTSILKPGSLVLVTGASGYIATHVVNELLQRGFHVRGTVRSAAKGDFLRDMIFKEHAGKFSYVIVEDIQNDGAFDEAVKSVHGILHIASPLYRNNGSDPWGLIIEPAKKGTLNILHATQKHNTEVTRIVITSSYAACFDERKGPGAVFTEKDWNIPVTELALEEGNKINKYNAYHVSKTWAEQAAWDFVKTENPRFSITTILPPIVCGPILSPVASPSALNTSNLLLWAYLTGSKDPSFSVEKARRLPGPPFVDVRDVAVAHVESLLRLGAGGLRIGVAHGTSCYQTFLDVIHGSPALRAAFPRANWGTLGAGPDGLRYDQEAQVSKEVLGMKYRSMEEMVLDAAESLAKWGKELGWEGA